MPSFHDIQTVFLYCDGNEFFAHFRRTAIAKTQVFGIVLEIKINKKVTETKHSQTPTKGVNIYFTIKITASLHISYLWLQGQKILHLALGQHRHLKTTCVSILLGSKIKADLFTL